MKLFRHIAICQLNRIELINGLEDINGNLTTAAWGETGPNVHLYSRRLEFEIPLIFHKVKTDLTIKGIMCGDNVVLWGKSEVVSAVRSIYGPMCPV